MRKILNAVQGWLPMTLIVLGSLWLLQAALAHTSGHGVIVRGLDYDAGTVETDALVNHSVSIINLSNLPLQIDARASCGCTSIVEPVAAVEPFHGGVVSTQIDTVGMHSGRHERTVMLWMQAGKSSWAQSINIHFSLASRRQGEQK